MNKLTRFALFTLATTIAMTSGCATQRPHRHDLDRNGYIFYLDGAGGGSAIKDYGKCVEAGLRNAGFKGDFYSFPWQTGLGTAIDQTSSVDYKRKKGAELAKIMYQYIDEHPGTPVSVIALSAGTAVAVYALEEMPSKYHIDSAVLLGSSVSAHYDLTKALRRIENKLTVYTSEKDAVLGILVPLAGTADRSNCGACSAGLHGFHLPPNIGDEARGLYSAKVDNIRWEPTFAIAANYGGHTDAVNENFVRDFVAPIVLQDGPHFTDAGRPPMY